MSKFIPQTRFDLECVSESNIVRSGDTIKYRLSSNSGINPNNRHSLFFTCEDRMFSIYKDEPFGEKLYMLIDDSLSTSKACMDRYCLDMSVSEPKPYMKAAAKKLSFSPLRFGIYPSFGHNDSYDFGIAVMANELRIKKNGFLRLRLDRWDKREGTNPLYTASEPDETIAIDIPEGSYGYRELSKVINIPTDTTACVLVTIEGINYSGEVYLERPRLVTSNSYNLLPPFDQCISKLSEHSWLGLNLSKKEFPEFEININGEAVAKREFFLSIHRYPNIELDIPKGLLNGSEDIVCIKYLSDYHDTVPLQFGECALLESDSEDFSLVYYPDIISSGEDLNILVESYEDNTEIIVKGEALSIPSVNILKDKGIHVLKLKHEGDKPEFKLSLEYKNTKKELSVKLVPEKDDILTGSGDMIYFDMSDVHSVEAFLKWYISNELGNLITVRPVYRWGGQRYINPESYALFTRICDGMGISYVNLSDGRDLPGLCQNPPLDMISGKGFLGRQLHERDGQLLYWGTAPRENDPTSEVFFDMALRLRRDNPDTAEGAYRPDNIIIRDGEYSFRRDIDCPSDMKAAYTKAALTIADLSKDGFTRHTGPTVAFKYFYENGFAFLGAETMDGAFESLISFLRGASYSYGKHRFGVHHALQWSSAPHNCEKRYRRYKLALYLSYMYGVTDINTEEGLYFLEARYFWHNRLSDACREHRKIARDFYRYIKNNKRHGRFYTPCAFIHGRYDGWDGFMRETLWGMPHIRGGDDAASWRLLKTFYPLNKVEAGGMRHMGYIPPDQNEPVGYFSGTPHGAVDCIPIENGNFSAYKLLCFAGYNAAVSNDFDRLYEYVLGGGTLIASWAHMSCLTSRADIDENKLSVTDHPLTDSLTCGKAVFDESTIDGKTIKICKNISENSRIIKRCDDGSPLVYEAVIGAGRVIMINTNLYPGNENIFDIYQETLISAYEEYAEDKDIRISCGNDVAYTRYIRDDGSWDIYFLAVDWYNDDSSPRIASITKNGITKTIELSFGEIKKINI